MPVNAALSFSRGFCDAGCTPPPQLLLTVYNPNAVALQITGVRIYTRDIAGNVTRAPMMEISVPTGPGQDFIVPALGTIRIGPMSFVVPANGNASSFQAVQQTIGALPVNTQSIQPSQRPQNLIMASATVYASDGSVNEASQAGLTVSYVQGVAGGSQGGFFTYQQGSNFLTGILLGTL